MPPSLNFPQLDFVEPSSGFHPVTWERVTITFLGHVVSKEGIRPDLGKIQAVLHFPTPKNVTSVRSFLGLIGYYQKYVRGYSSLAGPLFELTRKDVAFVWDRVVNMHTRR